MTLVISMRLKSHGMMRIELVVADQRTDGPTDRRREKPAHRDAKTHLKTCISLICMSANRPPWNPAVIFMSSQVPRISHCFGLFAQNEKLIER